MDPLISVISVNYNQEEHTHEFLSSIYKSGYKNIEVIVVDNGSKIPIDKSIEEKYKRLICIQSNENLGFAGGNNLGLKQANGQYIFLLNNDTIVEFGFFSELVRFLSENENVGIASPKIKYLSGQIQYAGCKEVNAITGRGGKIGHLAEDSGQFDTCYKTAYPHGAAMAIRKDVLDEVGLMPEEYFLYYEELDWSNQFKKLGYEIYFVGKASILHKESISTGKESPLKSYYLNRNRLLFLKRHSNSLEFILGILYFLIVVFPKNAIIQLINGQQKQFKAMVRGMAWHINKKYDFLHEK